MKLYDIYRETTQKQFYTGDLAPRQGAFETSNNRSLEVGPEPDNGPAPAENDWYGYVALSTIGGNIKQPTKTHDVRPIYPPIAQSARVSGVVIIEATIGPTGRVLDAKLLRSIPLLDAAALEAVRQWEFTPTLLNGSPVSVVMTVTVNFMLR